MENPYQASRNISVEAVEKPPLYERLAIGLICIYCAYPLVFMVALFAVTGITSGSHTYYRIAGSEGSQFWLIVLICVGMFIAGLALVYRSRWSVWLFGACVVALVAMNIMTDWREDHVIRLMLYSSFLAYTLVLRKRRRLR
jgi:hypothetical protein